MKPRPWLGLASSLGLHAGALALVLVVLARDEPLPALMVDLRDALVSGSAAASRPRNERAASPTPPGARRARSTKGKPAVATVASPPPPSGALPTAIAETPPPPPAPSPAPPTEPSREPITPALPPPSAVVEPTAPGMIAAVPEGEQSAPARIGVASGDRSGGGTRDRGMTGGGAASDSDGSANGDGSGAPGPRVALAPPGGQAGAGAEYGPYLAALRQRIQQSVRYPASARRRGLAGTVSVEILILANGTIGDVTLIESSSHSVLDDAALDTIRALPRLPLPPELPARPLRVRVPVVFQMR